MPKSMGGSTCWDSASPSNPGRSTVDGKKTENSLDKNPPMVSNIHMKKEEKIVKKPLTEEEVQDTIQEYREAVELIRTRGLNANVYGVPSTRRRDRR